MFSQIQTTWTITPIPAAPPGPHLRKLDHLPPSCTNQNPTPSYFSSITRSPSPLETTSPISPFSPTQHLQLPTQRLGKTLSCPHLSWPPSLHLNSYFSSSLHKATKANPVMSLPCLKPFKGFPKSKISYKIQWSAVAPTPTSFTLEKWYKII